MRAETACSWERAQTAWSWQKVYSNSNKRCFSTAVSRNSSRECTRGGRATMANLFCSVLFSHSSYRFLFFGACGSDLIMLSKQEPVCSFSSDLLSQHLFWVAELKFLCKIWCKLYRLLCMKIPLDLYLYVRFYTLCCRLADRIIVCELFLIKWPVSVSE